MKYKVIGWTWYDNSDIPFSNHTIGFAERNAIIDEIQKNKYLFSGWHHQEEWDNCVPVLNDGKKRGFSQRGWGGVMAEAYGQMGDYDYAGYTFYQSIESSQINFPNESFDPFEFLPDPLENEYFEVDVCEELFCIAQKKNPFYLEDINDLRYIDANDTITLHCNGNSLTFLVDDVNRDKKQIAFKKHHLINTKYKIIIKHKPMAKVYTRLPMIISSFEANDLFKECLDKYNFNILFNLIETFDMEIITNGSKSKKVFLALKKFISEYTDYSFNSSLVNKVLYYINDIEFTEEISYKVIKANPEILATFVRNSFEKGINIDKHISLLLKNFKNDLYISDILLRAIELSPNNKCLRKRYYMVNKNLDLISFILYFGINNLESLSKEHKALIDLDDFNKVKSTVILDVAYLMAYSHVDILGYEEKLCDIPSFYLNQYTCIKDGVLKYQEYVNKLFDLKNRLKELFLIGIKIRCDNIQSYLFKDRDVVSYIYTLDFLSGFKYSLMETTIKMYPNLKKYIKD